MTKQAADSIWSIASRIGGSLSLALLGVIAYFLIDLHTRFNQYAEEVTELRLGTADLKKDVAYHAVYITQYGERIKQLESK